MLCEPTLYCLIITTNKKYHIVLYVRSALLSVGEQWPRRSRGRGTFFFKVRQLISATG